MSSNRARAFAERRNTEEEVQTILKHNPNMARDTVAIVISALIATKTSTAFIQKAIRKFRAAVVVVQRVARKWYYWSRRCMLRLVEQWVIHDCEALKGNATVPTESLFSCFPIRGESIRKNKPEVSVTEPLGTDMPLFFSGQLRYRIVREVYIERRSVFRKRFKTWKHHLDSMECELQMVETKIRQLSNRERRESEAVGDGHRILSPKLVSMISQSLNERHSILIASIEKERQMSPVFDFTVQFSELQQRAILYCRKDASQLIKSVIDRLGIVPQENKIPQQEIDHFGHISATNSFVKNKIKFQGNMEVNTRKKKKKFLEKKNNNLMREMEDRYLDLTGPIMAASLSAQAISPQEETNV